MMKSCNYYLLLTLLAPASIFADVLFEENFDAYDDWATQGRKTIDPLPTNFDFGYTNETYHPADVPGSLPSLFISGDDTNQVFGGSGKALIATYETRHNPNPSTWVSDGFITKSFTPSDEVFVSFKIKFQPGFNREDAQGAVKLFRMMSWDGGITPKIFGGTGRAAPVYMFNWAKSNYGLRQFHAFRCDAQESNYFCTNPAISNAPRSINRGDMSANFTSNAISSEIPDRVNGGFLSTHKDSIFSHAQVYGDEWNTMEFYFKLNSAPGIQDGVYKFWLNGEPILHMNGIAWIGDNGDMNAKWNAIGLGGNGYYHWDTSDTPFNTSKERWVAFDEIVIRNTMPGSRPKPPSLITD